MIKQGLSASATPYKLQLVNGSYIGLNRGYPTINIKTRQRMYSRKIEIICIAGRQTKIDCVAWPFSEYSALFPKLVAKNVFQKDRNHLYCWETDKNRLCSVAFQ